MSLYYDAATILTSLDKGGSLKSRVYAKDSKLKSKPAHIYALISQTAKYDVLLSEIINASGILAHEPKLNPILALLLTNDHFFSKDGIAAGANHPLRQAIIRNKARLQSELVKARIRRRAPNVEYMLQAALKEKRIHGRVHPRWARSNLAKADVTLHHTIDQHFSDYKQVDTIGEVTSASKSAKVYYIDENIPNLLAFSPEEEKVKGLPCSSGDLILQDKASCFPAQLLIGDHANEGSIGDIIDGCAAPGNKTTHLAALTMHQGGLIYACERDAARSKILQDMVERAKAAKKIKVLHKQDFLALDPKDKRWNNVTHLLLDPSCSGSGIVGREDVPKLVLPKDIRKLDVVQRGVTESKKRKRGHEKHGSSTAGREGQNGDTAAELEDEMNNEEEVSTEATKIRLEKLSNLQSMIVEHAFAFPAARRITYSTCSLYVEENEAVVERVLQSKMGRSRGWRVLRRQDQVLGLRDWNGRGVEGGHTLSDEEREACLRCVPDDGQGTMGFFVCGFIRDVPDQQDANAKDTVTENGHSDQQVDDWNGFEDA